MAIHVRSSVHEAAGRAVSLLRCTSTAPAGLCPLSLQNPGTGSFSDRRSPGKARIEPSRAPATAVRGHFPRSNCINACDARRARVTRRSARVDPLMRSHGAALQPVHETRDRRIRAASSTPIVPLTLRRALRLWPWRGPLGPPSPAGWCASWWSPRSGRHQRRAGRRWPRCRRLCRPV